MPRIALPGREELSPEQQRVHDGVVSGPRGTIIGPLRAAIHNPELAEKWSALGEVLRFRTALPKRLNELAIIITARRFGSQIEWWVHARAAAEAGLPEAVIEAIRHAAPPPSMMRRMARSMPLPVPCTMRGLCRSRFMTRCWRAGARVVWSI